MIPNWKDIALRGHSMWAQYLMLISLVMPEMLFYLFTVDTSPRLWWFLALGFCLYGLFGRLMAQGIDQTTISSPAWIIPVVLVLALLASGEHRLFIDPPGDVVADVEAQTDHHGKPSEFLDLAVPFIGGWEGLRLVAYRDIVGVWTVCYGETKGVQPGDTYTEDQCADMLARELLDYRAGLHGHLTAETIDTRLPVRRDVAFTSLAYNVGVAGAGGSTAVRRLNAGNVAGACEALTWWNRAGGRVIRGLVNRRTEEHDLCMAGVA